MSKKTSQTGAMFNPFPGLRPFSQDESHLFFGREGQSKSVLKSLETNSFVAVIGASGSGKSSLIYCGVIPELKTSSKKDWIAVSTRPGNNPVMNLVSSISEAFPEKVKPDDAESFLVGDLSIENWVKKLIPSGQSLLLVIDQFEEIFRFKKTGSTSGGSLEEIDKFVDLIYNACANKDNSVSVVLTMRSDFIGECSVFQDLTDLINRSNYLIPQMTREDFRSAIEGPVKIGGAKIDEVLVDQLLDEVGDNTDQLPVLQHALMRTWDYWMLQNDPEKIISVGDYEAIGRMEKALSDHANEAYDELDESQRIICENIFKTITEKGGDNRGIRRPSSIDRVAEIARCTNEDVISIAEVFRIKGRTFLTPYQPVVLDENTVVDISHESLMRIWDRLRLWVDEEAGSVQMYKKLSDASELYQEGTTGLWRPPDLQLALNWREKQQPTSTWAVQYNPAFERAIVYLETSDSEFRKEEENKIRLQKRRLRVTRIFSLVLGGIAVIAMGLFLWTRDLQNEALMQKDLADERRIEADANAAEAQKQQAAAILARDSAEVERQNAIEASELALRNEAAAIKAQGEADANAEEAAKNAAEAQKNAEDAAARAEEARIASELAQKNADIAEERRMLSIAQSMAVKSDQMVADTLLKGLLAYQAYSFNREYKGIGYDPDIFAAAYSGLKYFKGADYNVRTGHSGLVRSLIQSGESFFSGSSDGKVIKWSLNDTSSEVILSDLPIVKKLLLHNDNLLCLTKNSIVSYDLTSKNYDSFEIEDDAISNIFLTKEGKYILVYNRKISITSDYKIQGDEIFSSTQRINITEFDREGARLFAALAGGDINYLKISGVGNGEAELLANVADANWSELSYNPQKNILVAGFGNNQGAIYLWDLDSGELLNSLRGHTGRITDISFSSDTSNLMATASYDNSVRLWHLDDLNTLPIVYADHTGWVSSALITDDGKSIISGDQNGVVKSLPSDISTPISEYCNFLTRVLSENEWQNYVGTDIDYKPAKCDKQ